MAALTKRQNVARETHKRVVTILSEQLGMRAHEVLLHSTMTDLGGDSLDGVEIVMALEEEFEVEITDSEMEKIQNTRDVIALVLTKLTPRCTFDTAYAAAAELKDDAKAPKKPTPKAAVIPAAKKHARKVVPDAPVVAQETEATESCVGIDPARARFVADFTGGLAKVELFGVADYDLARCIQRAVHVYESSYDTEGADAESKRVAEANDKLRADAETHGTELQMSQMVWGFYEKYQRLTIMEAVEAVVPPQLVEPVYLLIKYTWNDALDWAKDIMIAHEGVTK